MNKHTLIPFSALLCALSTSSISTAQLNTQINDLQNHPWEHWHKKIQVHNEVPTGPQCVGCKLPDMPIAAAGFHEPAPTPSAATHPLTSLPQLSSRPESNNILLLDFDGHTYTGNRWTNTVNPDDPIVTPVFTLDNDYQTFSDSELQAIQEIWARVSEDFAPWDVNVTTVDPGNTRMSQKKAQRCCIGGSNSDWYGSGAGGVAYINAFNWEQDEICFTFAGAFWGNTHNIAAVTSHELGHTLGLLHQSLWVNSVKEEEYRPGTGQGIQRHGAIMGNSYGTYSDTWYDGITPSQNTQADLSVISNYLEYVTDDHGDTTSEATVLENIHQQSVSGLIHSAQDVDMFAVTLVQGTFLAKAIPAEIGPNLDLKIELLNEQGQQVVLSNPATTLSASIDTIVSAGTYFLSVGSSGAYGKIGTYSLSMTQPGVVLDHYTIDENETAGATVGRLTLTNSATDIGGNISRVKSIATGWRHSLFLKKDAGLWAAGSNHNGELGDGTRTQQNSPIHALDTNVAAVAAGTTHSMILRQDGSVWTFGNDSSGELGNNTIISLHTYPVRACASGAIDISAQNFHGLILKADGSVLGMGKNEEGQLGDGTTTNQPSAIPVFQSGIRAISAGGYHSLFLKMDGTLLATGRNSNGQLGDDSTVNKTTPVQVDTAVAIIEAGEFHSIYLKEDGTLWATGKNSNGQLGDGTIVSKQVPVQITGIQGTVVALAAGGDHTLVLTSDGGLWGMGRNDHGQLGNGSTTDISTPQLILQTGVLDIAAGSHHSILLLKDGSVKTMGRNNFGQLGDGTTVNKTSPVTILPAGEGLMTGEESFTLTTGTGDTDNALFTIEGNQLLTSETFGEEIKPTYSIRVQGTVGTSNQQTVITLTTNFPNAPPTAITIDNGSLEENKPKGTFIGTLSATDPDDDSHTFSLTQSAQYPDNASFTINKGNELLSNAVFDFETKSSYTIELTAQDSEQLSVTKELTITVVNAAEAPTSIQLSGNSVGENSPGGTVIGNLTAMDQDVQESHLFTLLAQGQNAPYDNDLFQIIENQNGSFTLATASQAVINYETKSQLKVHIQVTDKDDLTYNQELMIDVEDVNDLPTSSNSSVTATEDTLLTFNTNNFPFVDEDMDSLAKVRVQAVSKSMLWLDTDGNGSVNDQEIAVKNDDEILVADLSKLSYLPKTNESGDDYATFAFEVHDGTGYSDASYTMTIHVTPINDLPTSQDSEVTTAEDTLRAFSSTDFPYGDVENSPLSKIKFKAASKGTFWLDADNDGKLNNGEAEVSNDAEFLPGNLAKLKYLPEPDGAGEDYATVEYFVHDGTAFSSESYTITIHVTPVNDLPVSADHAVTTSEGEIFVFSVSDFPYEDVENSPLSKIRLQAASDGTLWLDADNDDKINNEETEVGNNFEILVTDISKLKFLANLEQPRAHSATFQFEVSDDTVFNPQKFTMTIEVAAIFLDGETVEENQPGGTNIGALSFSLDYGRLIPVELDATQHVATGFDLETQNPAIYTLENAYSVEGLEPGAYLVGYNPEGIHLAWSMSQSDDIQSPPVFPTADFGGWSNSFYYSLDGGQTKILHGAPPEMLRLPSADDFNNPQLQLPLPITITQGQSLQLYFREFYPMPPQPGPGAEANNRGGLSLLIAPSTPATTFSLVNGEGDTDNASFKISGISLQTASSLDFETKETYSIRVQAEDSEGYIHTKVFTIKATDINDAPTAISIDSDNLNENENTGNIVGTLSATDQDANASHTFVLTESVQHPDNESFSISQNNELLASPSFDFEKKSSYTLELTATDNGDLMITRELVIKVNDINEPPKELTLSNLEIGENNATGTTVGTLIVSDEDGNEQHSLELTNTREFPDNASFTIEGTTLKSAEIFDFSTQSSYSIEITVTDKGGLTLSAEFLIHIKKVELDNTSIEENVPNGSLVGTLGFPLPQPNELPNPQPDPVTYQLVDGEGDSDNNAFTITTNKLTINQSPDFETKSDYSIRIKAAKQSGVTTEKIFSISIEDVNEVPLGITLNNNEKDENEGDDTKIGNLSVIDPDAGDTHTYSITNSNQYPDNGFFLIQSNELLGRSAFDFEEKSTYTIEVQVIDSGDLGHKQELTINILDINEAPEDLSITETRIGENVPIGTVIGNLSSEDQDANERHSYQLSGINNHPDNAAFTIEGNQLKTGAVLDQKTKNSYTILIKSTDKGTLTYEEEITIQVVAVDLIESSIEENVPDNSVVGSLFFPNQIRPSGPVPAPVGNEPQPVPVVYEKAAGEGDTDNDAFTITDNVVSINQSPDFEKQATYSLRVKATAEDGLFAETILSISIIDVNEIPTGITLVDHKIPENEPNGTVVGILGVLDQDQEDAHTYVLTESDQYPDNQFFTIDESNLTANAPFNYEEKNVYRIEVTVTDSGNLSHTQELTVKVTDVNEPSEQVLLSFNKFAEGREVGSFVAFALTVDPDFNETFTYTLVDGEGSTDNGKFQISGNKILNAQDLFLTNQQFYNIRLLSTDSAGHEIEDTFTLEAIDMSDNDAPSDIGISTTIIPENVEPDQTLALFTFTDEDAHEYIGGIGTYSLLWHKYTSLVKATVAAEKSGGHPAVISSEPEWNIMLDQVGAENLIGKNILLGATDAEEEGTWKWLSGEDFNFLNWEGNQPDNANDNEDHLIVSGQSGDKLKWSDVNSEEFQVNYYLLEQPVFYELVKGEGDTHNDRYKIFGNRLISVGTGDFETERTHSIRVRVTDFGGLFIEEIFTLFLDDNPDPPSDILLSHNEIGENLPKGSPIGQFSMVDPDVVDRAFYTILTDTKLFNINGDTLYTAAPLDFEGQPTHTLNIQVMDAAKNTFAKEFSIQVLDNNDAPTGVELFSDTVEENLPANSLVGTLTGIDPDSSDTHSFQLIGGLNQDYFQVEGDQLLTTKPIDFEVTPILEAIIRITDHAQASGDSLVKIKVQDTNDAPDGIELSNHEFPENLQQGDPVARLIATDPDSPFELIEKNLTWPEAMADAESKGGHLAYFPSKASWSALISRIEVDTLQGKDLWLGASDAESEGVWHWSNGLPLTYQRWANPIYVPNLDSVPPNNLDGNEHHLSILGETGTRLEWDDRPSEASLDGYILQLPHTFELVEGEGGEDNEHFQIVGNQLQMVIPADFETRSKYSILLKTTDIGGLSHTQALQLTATDAPDAPTEILLSNAVVPENQPRKFHIGNFAANDQDQEEIFKFQLDENSDIPNSNDLFIISGDSLLTNATLNFEDPLFPTPPPTYTIVVKVTDKKNLSFSQALTLEVSNTNDAPAGLLIDRSSFEENQPRGTAIGTLTAEDPDPNERHTFTVTGGLDRDLVYIKGNTLFPNVPFDFETQPRLDLRVTITDVARASSEFPLSIKISDAPDAPTDILLSNTIVPEGQFPLPVGTLSLVDEDAENTPETFTLSSSNTTNDNPLFRISGNELQLSQALSFEEKDIYTVIITGTDNHQNSIERTFIIEATDQSDAPTAIGLTEDTIPENTPGNTLLTSLTVKDEDAYDAHIFALIEDPSQEPTDNDLFELRKNNLYSLPETSLDFESKPYYRLYAKVTDREGNEHHQAVEFQLSNVNEAPVDILLNNYQFQENQAPGIIVGNAAATDPDVPGELPDTGAKPLPEYSDTWSWLLVTGEGDTHNRNFRIDRNGILTTTISFDYENQALQTQSIRIQATDAAKNIYEKQITLTVTNGNDKPTALNMEPNSLSLEVGSTYKAPLATLSAEDIDTIHPNFGETFTFSLAPATRDNYNANFEIRRGELYLSTAFQRAGTGLIELIVSDLAGETITNSFPVVVNALPNSPTNILLDNNIIEENKPAGTLVGKLTASDRDEVDTHTFALVRGDGDTNNEDFFIANGNELVTRTAFDFEVTRATSIRIATQDSQGQSYEKSLTIKITNIDPEIPSYQLTVNRLPDEGGLITGAGPYKENSIAQLTATADDGYTFAGWTGDLPENADSGDPVLDVKMDADKTINAYFARTFHSVEVSAFPERHGYASGGGFILSGTQIRTSAEELEGEDKVPFSHWRINGQDHLDKDQKILSIIVEDNLKLEAVFDIGLPEDFVLIPAGSYTRDYKTPNEHVAQVSAFYTSTHETTKEQWYDVYNWAIYNGYKFKFDPFAPNGRNRAHNDKSYKDDYPITGITWNDMVKWCNARSEKEGWQPAYYTDDTKETIYKDGTEAADLKATHVKWRERSYRLPTEAEWERAARGGLEYLNYPNGNTIDEEQAFYNQNRRTVPIPLTSVYGHTRPANGYGLYDVVGNAREACWDWYDKSWYENPLAQILDTTGPTAEQTGLRTNFRIARGGSSVSDSKQTLISSRLALKTWLGYAITLRPVFPAPCTPDATITLASSHAHLGTITGAGNYRIGDQATLSAVPARGAIFKEWQDTQGNVLSSSKKYVMDVVEDTTIHAIFEDNSGNPPLVTLLTFANPSDLGTVSGTGAYLQGSTIQLVATPAKGVDFAGWSGGASGTSHTIQLLMDRSRIVTGTFGDTSIDTDRDGLSDLYEAVLGSNPYESDSDQDKISDADEVNVYGSNPTKADTDGDGHEDSIEAYHRTSLTDPNDFPFLPQNGLERYFTFKGKPYDYSGNKGHGTSTDIALIADRWELSNNAYAFNGTSSFVEATGYNGITGSSARAISLWVQTTSGNSGPVLTYGSAPNAFDIQINDSGVLELIADAATLTGTTSLTDENWHQILVSVPEGATPADIRIYIDSQLETTTPTGDTGSELNTRSPSAVLIGKNSSHQHFTGNIDDIRIWSRELGTSEADKLHDLEVYKEPDTIRPSIVKNPDSQTAAVGDTISFTVTYKAKPAPTITWEKLVGRSWQALKGSSEATLTLTDVQAADATNYRVTLTNTAGSVYSRNARLTVLQKPTITEQPQDIAFLVNRGGRIYAHVEGSPKLSYEWFKDSASLGSSKGNFWFIPKTANEAEHGGTYSFKVTNAVGEVTSEAFTVSIVDAVAITQQPTPKGIISGASGSLTITAIGGGTLTYQWKKYDPSSRKYLDIEGATQATYNIESMNATEVGIYQCVVSNGASRVFSARATLSMYIPPTFKTQPRDTTIEEYASLNLTSLALADPAPTYMWQKYDANTEQWEDQTKYRRADLTLGKTPVSFSGKYRVTANNPGGTAISDEVDVVIHYKPVVTKDPVTVTANEDTTVIISVEAHALDRKGTDITYKWFHNKIEVSDGNGISGSSTNSLQISGVKRDHKGTWYCLLSNSVGETQSRAMKLLVIEIPYATTTLSDLPIIEGKPLSLSVGVRGSKPYTFQWYKDGQIINGATSNKFYLNTTSAGDAGTYTFEATNAAGKLSTSAIVTITGASSGSTAPRILAGLDTQTPDHDADGDGLPNLLEQALGSDPTNPDSTYPPTLDLVEDGTGQQYLAYHFTQNNSATNLTTHIEVSTDLITWEPLDLNEATLTTLDRGDLTQTTVYLPATNAQRFLRLRVEK